MNDFVNEATNLKTEIPEIPWFGMHFALIPELEELEYFGKGDRECYVDYQEHARMGIWKSTVTREYHSVKGESRNEGRRMILYEGRAALL